MKVLLVGGTGNISTSIVAALRAHGHDVSVVVRGTHVDELPSEVRRIVVDRKDRATFEACMQQERWDAVIDMIAFTADDAASVLRAFAGNTGHYVACSTVVTYGTEFTALPATEDEPQTARDAYGRGKVEMEDVLRAGMADGQLPITILRPSHTFGRIPLVRQLTGPDRRFLDRLRKGKPMLVVDTAETTRWMSLFVDDAAVAFAHCLGRDACFGRAYNVVGDETYSWADYHRRVAAALGLAIELVPAPLERIVEAGGAEVAVLQNCTAWDGWFSNTALKTDVPEFRQTVLLEEGVVRNVAYIDTHDMLAPDDTPWEDLLIKEMSS